MFVLAVSLLLAALHKLHNRTALAAGRVAPYAIGGVAAFWTIQRVGAFLQ
jgi:hypothetical protein